MRLASLRSRHNPTLAFVFTHTHIHTRKPHTLCPLQAGVPTESEALHSCMSTKRSFHHPLNITDIPLLLKLRQFCDMLNWYLTMAR